MAADDFLGVCENGGAWPDSDFAIPGFTRFAPVEANFIGVVEMHDFYVGVSLEVPFAEAAVVGVGAELSLIKWLNDDIAVRQLFHDPLVR